MADLEELGFIASPHTSRRAASRRRAATASSSTRCSRRSRCDNVRNPPARRPAAGRPAAARRSPTRRSCCRTCRSFAGVVMTPRRARVFRHIEFLRLSERRVLRDHRRARRRRAEPHLSCSTAATRSRELIEATNFLNQHYAGCTFEEVRERLHDELKQLRGEIAALMQAAVQAGSQAMQDEPDERRDLRRAQPAGGAATSRATWAACASSSTCSSRRRS